MARTQAEEDADALRVLIREAHTVMKDLKVLIKEAKEVSGVLSATLPNILGEQIERAVEVGLATYNQAIDTAIKEAEQAVYERFDSIAEQLLESPGDDGSPSVSQYAHLHSAVIGSVAATPQDHEVAAQIIAKRRAMKGKTRKGK